MSDASVTKAVPIEEQSPLVEALYRRLAAAEARITEFESVVCEDCKNSGAYLSDTALSEIAMGHGYSPAGDDWIECHCVVARDRRIAELEELLAEFQFSAGMIRNKCPSCGREKDAGHNEVCRICAALAKGTQ